MSTATPTLRLPLFNATPPMHAAYFSPPTATSPGSDSNSIWRPIIHARAVRRPRKSRSPTKMSKPKVDFTFITGNSPAQLKSKTNMTKVRKQAMNSYLFLEEKTGAPGTKRLNSTASDETSPTIHNQVVILPPNPVPTSNRFEFDGSEQSPALQRSTAVGSVNVTPTPPGAVVIAHILPSQPMYVPSRKIENLPFDIHEVPTLRSIGRALDPFRTMFQSSHPRVSVEQLKFHCARYFGTYSLGKYWIPSCLQYPHTFLSTLCLAAAHHDVVNKRLDESLEIIALRQDVIRMVGENLLNPTASVADHNIIAVSQLIIGGVIARKEADLTYHQVGMETMIRQRGGLLKLGVNGRLADAVSWVHLASAVLRETKPRSIYFEFCANNSTKTYATTATIPESPIYCPRDTLVTIQRSLKSTAKIFELLNDIRMMIDHFLSQPKQGRQNSSTLVSLYSNITRYQPVAQLRNTEVLTQADWKYEALRITALVQATAIVRQLPLSQALPLAVVPRKPSTTLDTSSITSRSNESISSSLGPQQVTPITEFSTSPLYSTSGASPAFDHTCFPFDAQSMTFPSPQMSPFSQRPSITSVRSNSSGTFYFPPPPLPTPSGPDVLLKDLKEALENSNLSDCWGDMAGALLWIGLVMGAASKSSEDKILSRYYSATAMRAGIMLCFEHPKPIHSTMVRMTQVIAGLDDCHDGRVEVATKKQRK